MLADSGASSCAGLAIPTGEAAETSMSHTLANAARGRRLNSSLCAPRRSKLQYIIFFTDLSRQQYSAHSARGWQSPQRRNTGTGRALVTFGINLNSSPAALLTRASDSAVCSSATQKPCVARHSGSGSGYYLVSSIYCALQRALAKYWDPPRSGIEQSAPPPPRKS